MNITYFSPLEIGEGMVCGAVLQSEASDTRRAEFIPTSLEIEPLKDVHERGGVWILQHLPESFPVFHTEQLALEFLSGMWMAHSIGLMTVDFVLELAEFLGADWHDKSEYGYEIKPRHNLN